MHDKLYIETSVADKLSLRLSHDKQGLIILGQIIRGIEYFIPLADKLYWPRINYPRTNYPGG